MTVSKFLKGAGFSALAIALAATALPAAAQDGQWRNKGERLSAQSAQNRGGGDRASRQASRPQRSAEQRQSQPRQARQERAPQRSWSDRPERPQQAQQRPQPRPDRQAGAERRDTPVFGRSEQRNRSYADPNRNVTYRSTDRRNDGRRDNDGRWNGNDRRDNDNRWNGNDRRGNDNRWQGNDRRGDYRDARRDDRRWDRGWRNDRRYDWQRYRNSNRVVFRLGSYHAPYRNYSYRRLGVGFRLDTLFFGNNYWINDPWRYRLPEVYGPYRWVRYYDDVLLVDIYSGQVVDVIYDFFW